MLQIQKFVCNMLQENCYVVADDSRECIIIDCGAFYKEEREAIVNYIDLHQLIPKHLVATHAHIDHNMGNGALFEAFGLKPEVSAADRYLMEKLPEQAEFLLHMKLNDNLPPWNAISTRPMLSRSDIIGSPSSPRQAIPRGAVCSIAKKKTWLSRAIHSSKAPSEGWI